MIRVLIADDEAIISAGIQLILEQDNEIEVVARVENGKAAFELCRGGQVDLVLMDINMPLCDGVEGTKLIKAFNKSIKVLILTTFYNEDLILPAFSNGADGYILKGIKPEEFVSTIKGVVNGLKVIHQSVFDTVLKYLSPEVKNQFIKDLPYNVNLNDTELKIIQLIVQGKTNAQIASNIYLSEGRVRNIITVILSKLCLTDRTQLAVYAVKNGLVK